MTVTGYDWLYDWFDYFSKWRVDSHQIFLFDGIHHINQSESLRSTIYRPTNTQPSESLKSCL